MTVIVFIKIVVLSTELSFIKFTCSQIYATFFKISLASNTTPRTTIYHILLIGNYIAFEISISLELI
jgi:hypothetical protein